MPTYTFDDYTYNDTIDGADDYVSKVIDGLVDELTEFEIDCADYHSIHVEDKLNQYAEDLYNDTDDIKDDVAHKIIHNLPLTDFEKLAAGLHKDNLEYLIDETIEDDFDSGDDLFPDQNDPELKLLKYVAQINLKNLTANFVNPLDKLEDYKYV